MQRHVRWMSRRKNGAARIVWFVDFWKEIEGWDVRFGIEEKGCHPWIGLLGNQKL